MSSDVDPVVDAWRELGVSMFDSAGNMRDIDAVFKDINDAMEGLPMEDQIRLGRDLAGSYGIVGFNALRATDGISSMEASMSGAASAADVADARMNTLAGRFMSFMGSVETLAITLGGLGEGPLTSFLEFATKAVNGINQWAEANPRLAQTIMVVVAAIAALGPVLMIIGSIGSGVSTLIGVFGGLSSAVGAIMPVITGFASGFMSIVSTVIPALISGFASLATAISGALVSALSAGSSLLVSFLATIGQGVVALVTTVIPAIATTIGGAISAIITGLTGIITTIGTMLVGAITSAITAVVGFASAMWAAIAPVLVSLRRS
jgi:hypothetical protein